jgi:hypothetical protein
MSTLRPGVNPLPASVSPVGNGTVRATEILRQDPIRGVIAWIALLVIGNVLLVLANTSLIWDVQEATWLPYSKVYLLWLLLLWVSGSVFLLSPPCRTRCNDLLAVLPLPARRLWLLHTTTVLGSSLGLLAITMGLMAGGRWYLARLAPERIGPAADVLTLGIQLGAALLLGTVALQSLEPAQRKVSLRGPTLLRSLLVLLALLLQLLVLSALPIYLALLPVAAAVAIGRRTYASLPEVFRLAPRDAVAGLRVRSAGWAPSRPMSPARYVLRLLAFLWRENHKKISIPYMIPVVGFPVLIGLGLLLSGFLRRTVGDDGLVMRLPSVPMVWYMLLAFVWPTAKSLHFVDSLPVPRKVLFAMVVLPPLAALLLGYGVGWGVGVFAEPVELIHYNEIDAHHYVLVPDYALEVTRDSEWPRNVAPWGESHKVAALIPVVEGGRTALYSPFSTPEGSSPEFVAWQISRAVHSVYGRAIPPAEIQQRYLTLDQDGQVVPRAAGLTLQADYPELRPVGAGPVLPVMLLAVNLPWLLLLRPLLRTFRASCSPRRQKTTIAILLVFCFVMYMGTLLASMLGPLNLNGLSGLTEVMMRHAGETAGMTVALWAACLILSGLGYLWAQRQFLAIEVSPGQPECTTL